MDYPLWWPKYPHHFKYADCAECAGSGYVNGTWSGKTLTEHHVHMPCPICDARGRESVLKRLRDENSQLSPAG